MYNLLKKIIVTVKLNKIIFNYCFTKIFKKRERDTLCADTYLFYDIIHNLLH